MTDTGGHTARRFTGDVFHGAYVYSHLADAAKSWEEHFHFGRAASAYKIQHLGNEAGLPTLADIVTAEWKFTGNTACTRSYLRCSQWVDSVEKVCVFT